ncbi:MAG: hypothetical protein AABY32_02080 [Nanoarchaeota archaeon]
MFNVIENFTDFFKWIFIISFERNINIISRIRRLIALPLYLIIFILVIPIFILGILADIVSDLDHTTE